ncbi:helix-turn-helix domain-containing protein [Terasakiella pusilla]|uniref:helix-turn-helix domain-containing protein n=1 Tax=Terasakiella pusilla TaxID=64973 RepID=UPI00048C45B2|nr:helix-turn-helix transcriptional regulator [Terasakiella pusilla]
MSTIAKVVGLPKKKPGEANPIDIHVGTRLRHIRTLLGMSQSKLGETVGLTFQQIQKYERGANRIGASRLYDLSRVLDVPISYFFEEMPTELSHDRYKEVSQQLSTDVSAFETDNMTRRETLELVRNYYQITNPAIRRRVFELTKVLCDESQDDENT